MGDSGYCDSHGAVVLFASDVDRLSASGEDLVEGLNRPTGKAWREALG